MKKTYKVKNYKGQLVESLERFTKKYKGMRIVEAAEKDGALNIVAEEDNEQKVQNYDDYEDYDDAVDTDSNYGDFWVELYKDHYGDPIRKEFDNFKDAFEFADSKTKSKLYETILIAINVAGGPSVASLYDNIHSCWVGRTK